MEDIGDGFKTLKIKKNLIMFIYKAILDVYKKMNKLQWLEYP